MSVHLCVQSVNLMRDMKTSRSNGKSLTSEVKDKVQWHIAHSMGSRHRNIAAATTEIKRQRLSDAGATKIIPKTKNK